LNTWSTFKVIGGIQIWILLTWFNFRNVNAYVLNPFKFIIFQYIENIILFLIKFYFLKLFTAQWALKLLIMAYYSLNTTQTKFMKTF
jgi:hypothetical protein